MSVLLAQIAVEIYKKQFPPASFEFAPTMCSEVHIGGELQAVVNLLGSTMVLDRNETRLQTLKVAIRGSTEVSVLPLVYLFTLTDCTTGVLNAYPRSLFQSRVALSGLSTASSTKSYFKYGEPEVGASDVGVVLKPYSDKMPMSSCDPLTLKDPRMLLIQAGSQGSYSQSTECDYMCDSFQQQPQQHSNSPKWLKSFCVDVLSDLYRSIRYDAVQRTSYSPSTVLGGLQAHPVIQNALIASSVKGEESPMLGYLNSIRNCVDAMESIASEIVSAHILSQDLIPLPFNFNRYFIPSLYNAQSLDEAQKLISDYRNESSEVLTRNCNVSSLLSAQTKKKTR
jgi:hypothetical protein